MKRNERFTDKEPKYNLVCPECGDGFWTNKKQVRFCCIECRKSFNKRTIGIANFNTPRGVFIVFNRDQFTCIYCGKSSASDGVRLQVDHITPRIHGGEDILKNLVTSCSHCNAQKGSMDLFPPSSDAIFSEVERRNREFNLRGDLKVKLSGVNDENV